MSDFDHRMLDVLQHASSLELFRLRTVIDRMLSDPGRILRVRAAVHLGQTVRYLDGDTGQMRSGIVIAMRDTQVFVQDERTRSTWKLPYAAIEPPAGAPERAARAADVPTAPPPSRDDFRRGEKVAFEDKHLNTVVGTIVRINQRTATVDADDGRSWRVGFGLLRRVVDV